MQTVKRVAYVKLKSGLFILAIFNYVAILACLFREGFVHFIFKKFCVLGSMGGMAVPAIHHFNLNINVGLAKRILFIIMASPA